MSVISRLLFRPSPGGISIEPLRRRDLPAVQVIERQVYPQPWSQKVFASELALVREGHRYYVAARRGGELVGYAGMMLVAGEAHVTNIAVDPQRHREGVGRRLLAELFWEARQMGCTAMTLEVRLSNAAAQALYARFGFEAEGIRLRYYENVEDAIVMWARDIDSDAFARRLEELGPGTRRGRR
jgi:ribosomal-protein-alanine N-acetyltransferase